MSQHHKGSKLQLFKKYEELEIDERLNSIFTEETIKEESIKIDILSTKDKNVYFQERGKDSCYFICDIKANIYKVIWAEDIEPKSIREMLRNIEKNKSYE